MNSKSFIRKIIVLISFLASLIPQVLFAFRTEYSIEMKSDSSIVTILMSEEKILYISEGTTVYGLNDISQKSLDVSLSHKKKKIKIRSKNQYYFNKNEKKQVAKAKQRPNLSAYTLKKSDLFYNISEKNLKEGTLNTILPFKVSIYFVIIISKSIIQGNTNSLYTYSIFFKGGLVQSSYFTRPPPFLA